MEDKLNFFVTIIKSTGEIIIQEGNIISIKIPKTWQKPDSNIDNPALWVRSFTKQLNWNKFR